MANFNIDELFPVQDFRDARDNAAGAQAPTSKVSTSDVVDELFPVQEAPSGLISGIGSSLKQGFNSAVRAGSATLNNVTGDLSDVERLREENMAAQNERTLEAKQFTNQYDAANAQDAANGDSTLLNTIGNGLRAIWDNPTGFIHASAEQTANMVAPMAGMAAGSVGGAAIGGAIGSVVPGVGTAAGVLVGTHLGRWLGATAGTSMLEVGGKAMEKAEGGLTADESSEATSEGVIKSGVIGAVDTATLGLGGKLMSKIGSEATQAGALAEAKVLMSQGVDVTKPDQILRALANTELRDAAKAAGDAAAKASLTAGQKAAMAGTGLGLETLSEGVGEYAGEFAATGKGDMAGAVMESLMGGGQSMIETAYNYNQTRSNELNMKGLLNAGNTDEAISYFKNLQENLARPVDEAIQPAEDAISEWHQTQQSQAVTPLGLPNIAGPALVTFPDGSTMTGAEAEQRRLDAMTQPADVVAPPAMAERSGAGVITEADTPLVGVTTPNVSPIEIASITDTAEPNPDATIVGAERNTSPRIIELATTVSAMKPDDKIKTLGRLDQATRAAVVTVMNAQNAAIPSGVTPEAVPRTKTPDLTVTQPRALNEIRDAAATADAAQTEITSTGGVRYSEPRPAITLTQNPTGTHTVAVQTAEQGTAITQALEAAQVPLTRTAGGEIKVSKSADMVKVNEIVSRVNTQFGETRERTASAVTADSILNLEQQQSLRQGKHSLGHKSVLPENAANNSLGSAQLLRYASSAVASGKQGLDGLEGGVRSSVMKHMLAVGKNRKVLKSVIELIPVDVMNMLARKKISPEALFNNPAMLKNLLVRGDGDASVSVSVDPATSILAAMARVATIEPAVFVGLDLGLGSVSRRSTDNTDNISSATDVRAGDSGSGSGTENGRALSAAKNPRDSGDVARATVDGGVTQSTIDDRHVVTPNSDGLLGGIDGGTSVSPPMIPINALPLLGTSKIISRTKAKALQQIGRITGTTIKFFHDKNDTRSEGFFRPKEEPNVVYINTAKPNTSMRRVFGHEVTHQLRTKHPKAWEQIEKVVRATMKPDALVAMAGDYFSSKKDIITKLTGYKNQGKAADFLKLTTAEAGYGQRFNDDNTEQTVEQLLMDELVSDLGGNRFGEEAFWEQVFQNIIEKEGTENGKGIIQRLMDSVIKMIKAFNAMMRDQNFKADELVDVDQVRTAMANAYATMIMENRGRDVGSELDASFGDETITQEMALGGALSGDDKEATKRTSDAGHKRQSDGRYVGAPDWVGSSPNMLTKIRKTLKQLASEGESGRYWYEKSSKAVLDMFNGNKIDAEKFVGLLAIYSQGTSVPANTAAAIKAWGQWKAGVTIDAGRFPESMGKKADAWLNRGEDWGGIKVNNFYQDLMEEIDPSKVDHGHSTMDMWMALAFDYGDKVLDQGPKYLFAQREIAKLAEELGWKPHQVQAAIWTAVKSRVESSETLRNEQEIAAGIRIRDPKAKANDKDSWITAKGREYEHFRLAHQLGMAHKFSVEDVKDKEKRAAFEKTLAGRTPTPSEVMQILGEDFADALKKRYAQMSLEAIPSVSGGVLPGIHNAPLVQQAEYLAAMKDAFTGADGIDIIDREIGNLLSKEVTGYSGWEGKTNIGLQRLLTVQTDSHGGTDKQTVVGKTRDLLDLSAAIHGLVWNQDGVAWHFPLYTGAKNGLNGVEFKIGRLLTAAESDALYKALRDELGHSESMPIPTGDGMGFRVLNFPGEKFALQNEMKGTDKDLVGQSESDIKKQLQKSQLGKNEDFADAVGRAVKAQPWSNEVTDVPRFESDGNLVTNDWSNSDAEYRQEIDRLVSGFGPRSWAGRSDIFKWIDRDLRDRADKVNKRFASKYGWGDGQQTLFSESRSDAGSGGFAGASHRADGQQKGVSATGIHYSKQERKSLAASMFGTGLNGAELERVKNAADERLRHRIYFYVNTGKGINPEFGVGPHAHKADLSNLYDADNDPLDFGAGTSDANLKESRILDAGFDGFISQAFGAAVLIGPRNVDVEYLGMGVKPTVDRAGQAEASQYQKDLKAVAANMLLPSGQMTGTEWKAMIAKRMPELDVSHLNDDEKYYKSGIVKKPAVQFSSSRAVDTNSPEFRKWFGDSKVVDADGKPLKVYHGTASDVSKFDPKRSGKNYPSTGGQKGFYFTSRPGTAAVYAEQAARGGNGGENTVPVYLSSENPYVRNTKEYPDKFFDYNRSQLFAEAERRGADGIIVHGNGRSLYVVFKPTQIKSAISNTGEFSDKNPDIRYSPHRFFSQLERSVDHIPKKLSTGKEIALWLKGNAGKLQVKKEEIEWTGVLDWLDTQKKVSPDDIKNFLSHSGVQVQDVVLGQRDSAREEEYRRKRDAIERLRDTGGQISSDEARRRIFALREEMGVDQDGEFKDKTKFSQYQLEGDKSDYRELLITLPSKKEALIKPLADAQRAWREAAEEFGERSQEALAARAERMRISDEFDAAGADFRSSHFDQPNILAHLRFSTRTDAQGRRVMFIDEVQSDWGQKGKKEGFGKTVWRLRGDVAAFATKAEADAHAQHVADLHGREKREVYEAPMEGSAPPAPFVTDTQAWTALALKRALMWAVQNGHDAIAFTTGEQQAARYDLSKQIKAIEYEKQDDGRYHVIAITNSGDSRLGEIYTEDQLEDVIGKDVAKKIIAGEGESSEGNGYKELSGIDLKMGGEGMTAYYDRILPDTLRKVLRQVGAGGTAVEQIEFDTRRPEDNNFYEEPTDADFMQQPGIILSDKLKEAVLGGMPLFSLPRNLQGQPINAAWSNDLNLESWDYVKRQLLDKLVDTKHILGEIRKAGVAIKDAFDPYLQETLYHGRAAKGVADFAESELKPLIAEMHLKGIEMQELEDYLWARHAGERNAQVASIGGMADGGSGLTNAEAAAILSGQAVTKNGRAIQIRTAKMPAYQTLAQKVKAINDSTLDLLVAEGLETQATVNAWKAAYSNYVPLKRDMESDNNFLGAFNLGSGTGQGFSVKGSASKRALGSNRAVIDILANVAMQRERAIVRAEKNKIAMATYGLALTAPNPDFWIPINPKGDVADIVAQLVKMGVAPQQAQQYADNLAQQPTTQTVNSQGVVTSTPMPFLAQRPDVMSVRVNGEDRFLMFSSDEKGQQMVRNLKNLDAEQMGVVMSNIAKVTRYFAAINTAYNPIFGLTNFIRDSGSAMLNLSSTPLAGKQGAVAGNVTSALRGIYSDLRAHRDGRPATSVWAQEFEEFQKEGGQTGYMDSFSNSAERAKAIKDELTSLDKSKWLKLGDKNPVLGWLSDYNTAIENAWRLSAYKVAKEQGMSKQQAAALAKNLTVNFNKKGLAATQIGALFAFFNAAVQGSARIAQTMVKDGKLTPAGQKIILGGLIAGSMQALMFAAAGWDDEEPPQYLREKNFIIPLDWVNNIGGPDLDGKYLAIPYPLGYHVIPNLGRVSTEFVLGGFKKPADRIIQLAMSVVDGFNPLGSSSIAQTIVPTIADPIIAMAENKDFTGKNIYKEDFNKMKPTAGWTRTKDTASDLAKGLSYGINYATGGGKYGIGALSPTPDQIDYLIGQATGGVGREVNKAYQAGKTVVSGEELPEYKIPVAGRFYGSTTGQASEVSKFYNALKRIGAHSSVLKEMDDAKDGPAKVEYLKDHPDARLVKDADKASREIGFLKRQKRDAVEKGDKERVKKLEAQITTKVQHWNAKLSEKE